MDLDRITQQADVMGGKACIRGMRVTVGMLVNQIGAGHSIEDILADYPYLEREDVTQALRYAAWLAQEREVLLGGGGSDFSALSARETEIITLIAGGLANKQLSSRLRLSENTVKNHISRIFSKLKISKIKDRRTHLGP